MTTSPQIIQGGMGAAVSNWQLANSVSRLGQMGVVSGTALAVVLSRRLQLGDPGGHMRRALSQFPVPAVAKRVLQDKECGCRTKHVGIHACRSVLRVYRRARREDGPGRACTTSETSG